MEIRDIPFTKPDFGNSPAKFFKEVKDELKKVSWPKRAEVVKLTLVVILVSAGVSLYLGGLDYVFSKLLGLVLQK